MFANKFSLEAQSPRKNIGVSQVIFPIWVKNALIKGLQRPSSELVQYRNFFVCLSVADTFSLQISYKITSHKNGEYDMNFVFMIVIAFKRLHHG